MAIFGNRDKFPDYDPIAVSEKYRATKTTKITVYDYTDAIHGGTIPVKKQEDVKEYVVDAWCVQGETGFIAFFYMDDMLCEAHGDDGGWHLVGTMHKHWLKEFKEVVNSIEERG